METIVKRAKEHDKEAFVCLMEQMRPRLYKIGKAILLKDEDVADAMQDTVLSCWEKITSLKQEKLFQTWVTRIMINHCNGILRKRKRMAYEEELPEPVMNENGYESAEWRQFLNCLGDKYRTVVYLYYIEGYTTKDIAGMLDMNESTIRTRLRTAKMLLEEEYKPVMFPRKLIAE